MSVCVLVCLWVCLCMWVSEFPRDVTMCFVCVCVCVCVCACACVCACHIYEVLWCGWPNCHHSQKVTKNTTLLPVLRSGICQPCSFTTNQITLNVFQLS